jgi:isopropylmalate/homocitrate/citramalate synthase
MIKKVNSMGIETITLTDTTGIANPQQVYDLLITIQNEFPQQNSIYISTIQGEWVYQTLLQACKLE